MSLLAQSSASDGGRVNITHLVSFYPEAQRQTAFPKCPLAGRLEGRDFPTSWPVHKISYIFHSAPFHTDYGDGTGEERK